MFDIGWSELVVIGVVALIVIGPKDLPVMFHSLGRITARARGMAREFSSAMEDAAKASGVQEATKELRDLQKVANPRALGLDADPRRMRAALRAQIARQILHFDAALNGAAGAPAFDSARVLRDLGGLKRLLDETTDDGAGGSDGAGSGDHDATARDGAGDDLPALRAEIARRAAALGGERADAGPAGEPAAAPDPGPGD